LAEAKKQGNHLIVAWIGRNVRHMKGKNDPSILKHSVKHLGSTFFVDEVIALSCMHGDVDYFNLVTKINPA